MHTTDRASDATEAARMVQDALAVHEANGTMNSNLAQRLQESLARYTGEAGMSAVRRHEPEGDRPFTGRSSAAKATSTGRSGVATAAARDYAAKLMALRQSELLKPLLAQAGQRMLDGGPIDPRTCSDLIDALKLLPWRPKAQSSAETRAHAKVEAALNEAAPAPLEAGYYRLDGDYYRVKISRTSGRPYAERWGGGEAGLSNQWSYELGRGMVRKLTTANLLTAEDAKAFGDEYHACIFCSQELTDKRSTDAGYGPICGPKNGLPWG
jgi:Family of unknown function (DUF6011)